MAGIIEGKEWGWSEVQVLEECSRLRRAIALAIISEVRQWTWAENESGAILLTVLASIVSDMIRVLASGTGDPDATDAVFCTFLGVLLDILEQPRANTTH